MSAADWIKAALAAVAGTGLASVAIAFFTKSIVTLWLNKDLERFKSGLLKERELDRQKFQHGLKINALEHEVRFSELHARRAEAVLEIYRLMVAARTHLRQLVRPFQPTKVDYKKLGTTAYKSVSILHNKIIEDALFFDESLADRLLHLSRELHECILSADLAIQDQDEESGQWSDAMHTSFYESFKKLDGPIVALQTDIAQAFRFLLGTTTDIHGDTTRRKDEIPPESDK